LTGRLRELLVHREDEDAEREQGALP
jgi:hypothetical protein